MCEVGSTMKLVDSTQEPNPIIVVGSVADQDPFHFVPSDPGSKYLVNIIESTKHTRILY